ncbi:MAG: tetratricopeptide repeat protein [Anaerolineales bacterium]
MIETPSTYIPMDRRQALLHGQAIPEYTRGAALFADISGFTALTEALVEELGPQRGAEELTHHLNQVYDALIGELHRYGGSVLVFSGDAITCWLDGDVGLRATTCALAMQAAMQQFQQVTIPSGAAVSLAVKVAVATGSVRRVLVGDPAIQIMDAMAGSTLDRMVAAEHHANKGEVVLGPYALAAVARHAHIAEYRRGTTPGARYGVVAGLRRDVPPRPWSPIPPEALPVDEVRAWLLPQIYQRLSSGQGEFMAELRPAAALFLRFSGLEYDVDREAGKKLDTFVSQVQRIFARYDGAVLQLTIGDKGNYLYAVFGAPITHEDNAMRAVSAAVDLREAMPTLPFIRDVQIGIAQGRMRTGAYGASVRRTYGAIGDDVNLAARLMQTAAPSQILISKHVWEEVESDFISVALPPVKLKGKRDLIPIFSVEKLRPRQMGHLQAAQYTLPMVGREAELALIAEKLEQAQAGRGQIVGITAEAGLGKSRLVAEVIGLAQERGFALYGGECQSYGTDTSYLVWQAIWQAFFGLDPGWPLETHIQALEQQLRQIDPALVQRLPLLGAVLNLSIPDNDMTRALDAKLRKTSLETMLVDCVRARASSGVVLMFVLEDVHWLDALSHDLLEAIGQSIADLPVVIVLAYRPPTISRLETLKVTPLPYFTEIALTEFDESEVDRLIALKIHQFYGDTSGASEALVAQITARAEGNPFYIEELLNYLHNHNLDLQAVATLAEVDLPSSLHSLILSRIDQLTESQKSALKVASVVGRVFRAAWLWGAYPQLGEMARVRGDLDILRQMDLMLLESRDPELVYFFKHIITQEVAYETLPYAFRAMLHEQIGRFIEQTYPDKLDQFVDLLAYHYEHSENEVKKREYLLQAGEWAQEHYANEAAISYYRRLLPLLADEEQIDVMFKLGQVLERVGEWEAAHQLYQQAHEVAKSLSDPHAQARCYMAIGELLRKQGQYDEASLWLQRAQFDFENLEDREGVGQVLHYSGTLAAQQGNYDIARQLYEASLDIRRELDDKPSIASLLNNLGIIARFHGNTALAESYYKEAAAIWRDISDKHAIAIALNNLGNLALDKKDFALARERIEEAVILQRDVGDKWYLANSLNNLGNVVREQGDYEIAYNLYRESLTLNYQLGDKRALAYLFEDIGCTLAKQGQAMQALELRGAAHALRAEIGAPLSEAEQQKLETHLAPACAALDEDARRAAERAGARMSLDEVMDYIGSCR